MKKLLVLVLLLLLSAEALGFSVDVSGVYSYRYNYLCSLGDEDLFGNRRQIRLPSTAGVTSIGLAGPFGRQVLVEGLSSKGADASWLSEELSFRLKFLLNPAVALHLRYSFQTDPNAAAPVWAAPYGTDGRFFSYGRSEEARQTITTGALNYAYATMQTPIGMVFFGRMPLSFGPGWSGYHSDDTALALAGLRVSYGPLAMLLAHTFAGTMEYSSTNDVRNVNLSPLTLASPTDKNEMPVWNSLTAISYDAGAVSCGLVNRTIYYSNVHTWPQGGWTLRDDRSAALLPRLFLNSFTANNDVVSPIYGNVTFLLNTFYVEVHRGQIGLNAEIAREEIYANRQGGRPISGHPWSGMLEMWGMVGPARLSVAGFYRSGHDRAGGRLDTVSATGQGQASVQTGNTWNEFLVLTGAGRCVEPYGWIFGFYGGGNNGYDGIGNPTYTDLLMGAVRLDYALASNLNLWMSGCLPYRASKTGTGWGQYTGGIGTSPLRSGDVPDTQLGPEVGGGFDWKLLENTSLKLKAGCWFPGKWFSHAYTSWSTVVDTATADTAVRIDPSRRISPIFGLVGEMSLVF